MAGAGARRGMPDAYLVAKFAHVLVAIVALGASAGLGIVLELFGDDPRHGAFVLRAIRRVESWVVLPGYVLMLATGLWMTRLAWPLTTHWLEAALALWAVGLALLGGYLPILRRQIGAFERDGPASARYRRLSLAGRVVGAAGGLVVVAIVWLMVTKPALPWW